MAADAPEAKAAPASEPKKSEGAPGWIAIPGTSTQMKLTGAVQVNLNYDVDAANDSIVSYNALTLKGDPGYTDHGHFGATARDSRFGLLTLTKFEGGAAMRTMFEIDFYEKPVGNAAKEQVLNSFPPRIRHAYGEFSSGGHKLLFGQTWSTFMEVAALSERLDQGSPGGSQFVRQPQVRYTLEFDPSTSLSLAVENPASAATNVPSDNWKNSVPDFIAKLKYGGAWGFVTVQAVVRDIQVSDGASLKASVVGFGAGVDGRIKTVGKSGFAFQLAGGPGIGRYLKELEGQESTLVGTQLKATNAYGGTLAYQHYWSEEWRTNLIYAQANIKNQSISTTDNKTLQAAFVNAIYSPVKNFDVGLQYLWAKREIEDGTNGTTQRITGSMKYSF